MSELLVEVKRGEIVECVHRGNIAVVDSNGKIRYSVGNPQKMTYLRSAAKPIQAMNVILSGAAERFGFTNEEIAIICSSHYGEKNHIKVLNSLMNKTGIKMENIQAGIVSSLNPAYALQLAWEQTELTPLYNDCSGKHLGFLSVCLQKGYPIDYYLKPTHPCQQEIISLLNYICEIDKEDIYIGIDGCSAPVHAMPLYNMALGFAKISNTYKLDVSYRKAADRVFTAMNEYPEMISGTGGFCTELIKNTNGKLIGKIGAEGVYCIGLKDRNLGIAIKIESGSMAMLPPVVIQVLKDLDVLTREEMISLYKYEILDNLNDVKTVVGRIKPMFRLTSK